MTARVRRSKVVASGTSDPDETVRVPNLVPTLRDRLIASSVLQTT